MSEPRRTPMQKTKRKKFWGIVCDDNSLHGIYDTKEEAVIQNRTAFSFIGKIVPCYVTYALRRKRK